MGQIAAVVETDVAVAEIAAVDENVVDYLSKSLELGNLSFLIDQLIEVLYRRPVA